MEETKRELTEVIKKEIDFSEKLLSFCQARRKRSDSEVVMEFLGFLYNLLKKAHQGASVSVLCKEIEDTTLAITTANTDWVNTELDYMKVLLLNNIGLSVIAIIERRTKNV